MTKKQDGGSRNDERGSPRDEAAADKKHRQVKTPADHGEHPPGMGEDENETYVPERERP